MDQRAIRYEQKQAKSRETKEGFAYHQDNAPRRRPRPDRYKDHRRNARRSVAAVMFEMVAEIDASIARNHRLA